MKTYPQMMDALATPRHARDVCKLLGHSLAVSFALTQERLEGERDISDRAFERQAEFLTTTLNKIATDKMMTVRDLREVVYRALKRCVEDLENARLKDREPESDRTRPDRFEME